jgi:hypothetical protein
VGSTHSPVPVHVDVTPCPVTVTTSSWAPPTLPCPCTWTTLPWDLPTFPCPVTATTFSWAPPTLPVHGVSTTFPPLVAVHKPVLNHVGLSAPVHTRSGCAINPVDKLNLATQTVQFAPVPRPTGDDYAKLKTTAAVNDMSSPCSDATVALIFCTNPLHVLSDRVLL